MYKTELQNMLSFFIHVFYTTCVNFLYSMTELQNTLSFFMSVIVHVLLLIELQNMLSFWLSFIVRTCVTLN